MVKNFSIFCVCLLLQAAIQVMASTKGEDSPLLPSIQVGDVSATNGGTAIGVVVNLPSQEYHTPLRTLLGKFLESESSLGIHRKNLAEITTLLPKIHGRIDVLRRDGGVWDTNDQILGLHLHWTVDLPLQEEEKQDLREILIPFSTMSSLKAFKFAISWEERDPRKFTETGLEWAKHLGSRLKNIIVHCLNELHLPDLISLDLTSNRLSNADITRMVKEIPYGTRNKIRSLKLHGGNHLTFTEDFLNTLRWGFCNLERIDEKIVHRPIPLRARSFSEEESLEIFVQALHKETQATAYDSGQGVLQNPREATRLYREAFQLYKNLADSYNHTGAQHHAGLMHLEGRGSAPDEQEGERLLLLACDKGYGPAEYRMYLFYKDSNPILAQQLLVRAVLHSHEEAQTLFKSFITDLDLSEPSVRPYLKAIVESIVAEYANEGMNAKHPSWNHPDLLWHLYTDKASPEVFAFLQRRLPNYIEESRDTHLKTLSHRLLEDWDHEHDPWFQTIFDLTLNGLREADIFDGMGSSLLDISCMRLHTTSFQQLVKKGAKKLKLDQLDAVAAFYLYLKHHPERDQEAIQNTLEAFKQLEESNRHLKFRMAMEHLLGGPLTKQGFSSNVSMMGTQSGSKALPLNIFQEGTRRVIRANTEGRATVAKATAEGYTLYFKFFPELPGIEQAVSLLTYDLLGFGTTLSELFNIPTALQVPVLKPGWVTGNSLVEEKVENIPVLISLGIEGRTLKQVFENPIDPATQRNTLENLYEESLYALMLVAMLTNPEDGKGDNYIAEPFITHEGQIKYRIVGIDNDHAFVPSLADAGSNRVRISTKTILYAFDQITKPMPENVRTLFTSLDLDTTLRSWLGRLRDLNGRYAEVFRDNLHNQMLFDRYRSFIGIPFSRGALAYLYTKFIRLRQALASSNQPRPLDLFMAVEPFLSGRYGEEIRATAELSAFERFKRIEGKAATKTLSRPIDVLTSYHIPNTPQSREAILRGQQYSPGQATDELEEIITAEFDKIQSGQLELFRRLKRGDQIETALEGMNFGALSFEENVQFLKVIQEKLPLLHKLILRNHQSLKTTDMKEWTSDVLKRLTHITLSGCQGIDQDGLINIAEQADNLVYLDISGNATLQVVARRAEGAFITSLPLSFKHLTYLDASNCQNFGQVNIEALELEVFNIENDPRLILLIGIFPKLRYLNIRGTGRIDKAKVTDFIAANPFFFKDGHLEIDESNPNAVMIKEAQQFIRGKLIYRPEEPSVGESLLNLLGGNFSSLKGYPIEFPVGSLLNPLEGEFDLSRIGDIGEYLSIHTGYKKTKKPVSKDKVEIWFVPRFLGQTNPYFQNLFSEDKWPADSPIGIFWTWSDDNLAYYDYLIVNTPEFLSNYKNHNLYIKWESMCTSVSWTGNGLWSRLGSYDGPKRSQYMDIHQQFLRGVSVAKDFMFVLGEC